MENNYKISANSVEQHLELQTATNELPELIKKQIVSVEGGLIGIVCILKRPEGDKPVNLRNSVCLIKNFGDYIGIYDTPFFFKIPIDNNDSQLSYFIISEEI